MKIFDVEILNSYKLVLKIINDSKSSLKDLKTNKIVVNVIWYLLMLVLDDVGLILMMKYGAYLTGLWLV